MATYRAHRFLVAGYVAMAVSSGASAQDLKPVANTEITAGVRSCIAATTSLGLEEQKLLADGWHRGTMSSSDGKPVDSPISVYSRNGLLMMRDRQVNRPICMFSARIASVGEFAKLQTSMAATYGAPVKDEGKGEQVFFTQDKHIVDLASTGSTERPAVRVAVGFVTQETK